MKSVGMVFVVGLIAMAGCTMPTQRIAADSLQRGIAHENSIVYDLSNIAKQAATDKGVAAAKAAAIQGSVTGAQSAVETALSEFEQVCWLQIQHERARALMRVGQRYIWSQEGIVDVLLKEFDEAKANAKTQRKAGEPVDLKSPKTKVTDHELDTKK